MEAKTRRELGIIGAIAAVLVLAVGGCAVFSGGGEGSSVSAELKCEGEIEARLKSPATADFTHTSVGKLDSGAWRVDGFVDSDNGLGAKLRSEYGCTVEKTSDGWDLRTLDLE